MCVRMCIIYVTYIGVCAAGEGGGGREVASGAAREGADSVNGILLGHPFTRTRRKLEDLIWRAVWIAFVPAMPPIEPSVIYARARARTHTHTHTHTHMHTYYARVFIHETGRT